MNSAGTLQIIRGYLPGSIGRICEMHACFYSRHAGFGQFFESQVASGLAEFTRRLSSPRNGLWLALDGDKIAGSIAIDGEDLGGNTAHLRWFIMDDGYRGQGMGRMLLEEAVSFCDSREFSSILLWTFKGLDSARKLYEKAGFTLKNEQEGRQWGESVTEQCFIRPITKIE